MKQLTAETFKEYAQRLEKSGIKQLGEGAFGKVYQHPTLNNVAVKIVAYDPRNRDWLAFCRKAKGNPYLPVLYGVQTIHLDNSRDEAYVAFMEKLNPCPLEAWLALRSHVCQVSGMHDWTSQKAWSTVYQETQDPGLRQVAKYLSKAQRTSLDLTQNNFMLRNSNQLVFVDPV